MTKTKTKDKTITEVQSIIDRIDSKSYYESPFYFAIECEYDRIRDCERGGCDSICRCSTLENVKVVSVDIDAIVSGMLGGSDNRKKGITADPFLRYCVDRIVRIHELYDTNNWEPNITGGYYGEECDGAELSYGIKKKLIENIGSLEGLDPIDMIKTVLKLEYGYLLPKIKDMNQVEIIDVALDRIKLFNEDYSKKVSQETVDHYVEYDFPRAICTKSGELYAVIDGFHRMLAAQKNNKETVSIIVLS